jgi:PPOX class probable F420-dependent enzyme
MAFAMNTSQVRAFLGEGTRTGALATTRASGSPHVVPVWFVLDGEDIVFMTGENTVKAKAIRRDPRVALSVDLPEPPYAFVLVEGAATVSSDLEAMLPWSIKIAERYMGADKAEDFGRRNAVDGELLVRLHPEKVTAYGAVSE